MYFKPKKVMIFGSMPIDCTCLTEHEDCGLEESHNKAAWGFR